MRVHEYGDNVGLSSEDVLSAIKDLNADLSDKVKIDAATAVSGLSEREQKLLNDYLQLNANESAEDTVNQVFGLAKQTEVSDPLEEEDAVDAAFANAPGHSPTKEVPQRQYACLGRKLRGKGPTAVKLLQVANDESEAINLVCVRARINPSDYKFNVRKLKELEPKIVKGSPLKNVDAA